MHVSFDDVIDVHDDVSKAFIANVFEIWCHTLFCSVTAVPRLIVLC